MKSFNLTLILVLFPLISFAGGSDGFPGILNPLLQNYVPGIGDGGLGSINPVDANKFSEVRFNSLSSEGILFELKNSDGLKLSFVAPEVFLEESAPDLLDALVESSNSSEAPAWVEL